MENNHEKMFRNPAVTEQTIAFNEILPYERNKTVIPQGITYDKNGNSTISIYAPDALSVKIEKDGETINMVKQTDGFWKLTLCLKPGFCYIQFIVDGAQVLSPMLPIGYGYSRPYNFLEIQPAEEFFLCKEVPHGSVRHEYFYSSITGTTETCLVYTPPTYDTDGQSYPVLYLQHGHGENETGWVWQGKVNFILDNLIAEGKAVPMVIVMNNGMVQTVGEDDSIHIDFSLLKDRLLQDVIPFIEKKFRVKNGYENRGMAGLSMGSIQTSMTSFTNIDKFAWIGLFSGFMKDFISTSNKHLEIFENDTEKFNNAIKLFYRAMGREDFFFQSFLEDDKFCEDKGIQCVRKEYTGGHDWNVWRHCAYDFLQMLFK